VLDEDERPIELAQIQFTSVDPKVPVRTTLFSDSTGKSEFEDLKGLSLRLLVSAPGYLPFQKQYKSTPEALEIVLRHGVIVEGRVTSVRGRREVSSARVTLQSGSHRDTTYTDGFGKYHFDNVPPGPVHISVSHDDFALAGLDVRVEPTGRDDRAFEVEDIDLVEGATLSGVVSDTSGSPVRRARVGLGVAPSVVVQGELPEGFVLTDSGGNFELRAVAPGHHEVSAYAEGVGRGVREVDVEAGGDVEDVDIQLDEPADESDVNLAGGGVALTLGERDTRSGVVVVVVEVVPGGEAERAGILPGDVVVSVDGKRARGMRAMRKSLEGRVGSDVVVTVRRDGKRSSFRVRREAISR
jgi:hypothetical protein